MNCTTFKQSLDAWIDGHLDSQPAKACAAHVADCVECAGLFDQLREQDAKLRTLLADQHNVAERVAKNVSDVLAADTRLANDVNSNESIQHPAVLRAGNLWQQFVRLFGAMAAGFLIALAIFQPWNSRPADVVDLESTLPAEIGKISVQMGAVEFRPTSSVGWFACPTDSTLREGVEVRTSEASVCEIMQNDGGSLKLDNETGVAKTSPNEWELNKGRLFVRSANEPVSVSCNGVNATVEKGRFDLKQVNGQTQIIAIDAPVAVSGKNWSDTIPAGHVAECSPFGCNRKSESSDPLLATRWVHDIIALKSSDPDAIGRVDSLMASIGQSKMDFLYEKEILALGPSAVDPLIAYLNSPAPEHQDVVKRRKAARILSALCTRRNEADLVKFLDDDDVEFCRLIEAGLERVTGRSNINKAGRPSKNQWQNWLKKPDETSPWKNTPKKRA